MCEVKTFKLEMHAHIAGGSACAKATEEELAGIYAAHGYGGVTLTTHYCEDSFSLYPGETLKEKLDFYFGLYDKFRAALEKRGMRPFLGAEVRVYDPEDYFTEFLLYGFDKAFFYDNPPLYTLTQRELFELCDGAGVFMAQSHPFRSKIKLGYYAYMHGAEVFNGHPRPNNRNPLAELFAESYDLKKIAGSDFHEVEFVPNAGILVPENIDTDGALKAFLFAEQPVLIKDGKIG